MTEFWQPPLAEWDQIIRSVAEQIRKPVPENCKVGIYPLREINAVARAIRGGTSYEIGINAGLLAFVSSVANISGGYFPFGSNPQDALNDNLIGGTAFAQMLLSLAGLTKDQSLHTAHLILKTDNAELATMLRDLSTFHVVAHEYAHVMLGHHKRLSSAKRRIKADHHGEFDEMPLSHELEFEADELAQVLTLSFAELCGMRLALALWSIDFYFASVAFLERFISGVCLPIAHVLNKAAQQQGLEMRLPTSISPSGTHPEPHARREVLKQIMVEMLGGQSAQGTEIGAAYEMASRTDLFLEAIWSTAAGPFSDGVTQALQRN